MYKTYVMSVLTYGLDIIILNKQQLTKIKRTETNCVKNLLNISLYCKNTALLKACNITTLEDHLYIAQLSLFKRLNENQFTKSITDEFENLNVKSDFIKRIDWLISDYTNEHSKYNRCEFEIDVIKLSEKNDRKTYLNVEEIKQILTSKINISSKLENKLMYNK